MVNVDKNKNLTSKSIKIVARDISFEMDNGTTLLKNIHISFGKEKSGLVGKNGIGKTTLLKILIGELSPTRGKIENTASVAYLPQYYQLNSTKPIADVFNLVHESEVVERRVLEEFNRLNLKNVDLTRKLNTLSGGERTKVFIAKLLFNNPDFLIMDEPSNNLDQESRKIIHELVKGWKNGLLVVSHDRTLLNLTDRILELSEKGLKIYGGNYDNYKTQKQLEISALQKQLVSAQQGFKKTKARARRTILKQEKRASHGKRIRKKTGMPKIILGKMKETSESTSSRLKEVHSQRIDLAAETLRDTKERIPTQNRILIDLPETVVPNGKLIARLKNVFFSYNKPEQALFRDFDLSIYGPARIHIAGANGSGKTTLVKLILGELKPLRGNVVLGVDRVAYLDQETAILDHKKTLIENLKRIALLNDSSARSWLAKFLFRREDVFKKIDVLSGGEKMRAALSCILAGEEPPQLLVLDEPTNNLDIDSTEQVESALLNFRGALIVISHDIDFLKNIEIKEKINLS